MDSRFPIVVEDKFHGNDTLKLMKGMDVCKIYFPTSFHQIGIIVEFLLRGVL